MGTWRPIVVLALTSALLAAGCGSRPEAKPPASTSTSTTTVTSTVPESTSTTTTTVPPPARLSAADLLAAPVPALCNLPAGTLRDGELPLVGDEAEVGYLRLDRDTVRLGDLDGDGIDEAVAIVECFYAGSAGSVDRRAVVWRSGPEVIGVLEFDGSPLVTESTWVPRVYSVAIANGVIVAGANAWGRDDSRAAPTVFVGERFTLRSGRFLTGDTSPRLGDTITENGIAPARAGMTYAEAAIALNTALHVSEVNGGDPLTSSCTSVETSPDSGFAMLGGDGRVTSFSVYTGTGEPSSLRTEAGIGLGSTEEEVEGAYGSDIWRADNEYSEIDDVYVSGSRNSESPALRFELSEQHRVRTIHGGWLAWVSSIEGCL